MISQSASPREHSIFVVCNSAVPAVAAGFAPDLPATDISGTAPPLSTTTPGFSGPSPADGSGLLGVFSSTAADVLWPVLDYQKKQMPASPLF